MFRFRVTNLNFDIETLIVKFRFSESYTDPIWR